jgi:hypothetical protein
MDWLEGEGTLTANDIRREVALDSAANKDLELTGLEPTIAMLALKAVTGIASGFAGRAFYDSWKKARTRKQLDELRARLRFDLDVPGVDQVSEATIRQDLVDSLVDQGLTVRQADKIVDKALRRIRARLQTKPT